MEGHWGNPLGVFLDGESVPEAERQGIAAELGFSETVFVEDPARGRIRIHTPEVELAFAGHPTVGTAWLLAATGGQVELLRPPAGEVGARAEADTAYVTARPEWVFPFEYRRHGSAGDVEALDPATARRNLYAWSWLDEKAGIIRARSFVPEEGIEEDEATGSAALVLCAQLGRPLRIHQGRGSIIEARPLERGRVEIGGRVAQVERRDFALC